MMRAPISLQKSPTGAFEMCGWASTARTKCCPYASGASFPHDPHKVVIRVPFLKKIVGVTSDFTNLNKVRISSLVEDLAGSAHLQSLLLFLSTASCVGCVIHLIYVSVSSICMQGWRLRENVMNNLLWECSPSVSVYSRL
jgi:hypothetical protein